MSKSRFTRENAFSVGIRQPGSGYVPPDTDKDEKDSTHAIDLEVSKLLERPSWASTSVSMPEATLEMIPRNVPPEIRAAQKLLAQIVARIVNQKRQKTDEH